MTTQPSEQTVVDELQAKVDAMLGHEGGGRRGFAMLLTRDQLTAQVWEIVNGVVDYNIEHGGVVLAVRWVSAQNKWSIRMSM